MKSRPVEAHLLFSGRGGFSLRPPASCGVCRGRGRLGRGPRSPGVGRPRTPGPSSSWRLRSRPSLLRGAFVPLCPAADTRTGLPRVVRGPFSPSSRPTSLGASYSLGKALSHPGVSVSKCSSRESPPSLGWSQKPHHRADGQNSVTAGLHFGPKARQQISQRRDPC